MTSFKIPPSALIFLSGLAIFTIIVSVLSEGMGGGVISTSFIKTIVTSFIKTKHEFISQSIIKTEL